MSVRVKRGSTVLGVLTSDPTEPKIKKKDTITSATGTDQQQVPSKSKKQFSFLYSLLNPRSRQWQAVLFKTVIFSVIVLDLASFILSTEKALEKYHSYFHDMEMVSSAVFLLEYLARLVICVERPRYRHHGPFWGRLRFACSGAAILDALATLPFFIDRLVGSELPRLTYLRFLRMMRITKTSGATRATSAVYRVIYYNGEILYVATFVCIMLVLGTGVILYYLRPVDTHLNDYSDEEFQSILSTMYLATLMLTGQGSPQGDLPWYTKVVVLGTSIVSVAMFAIPASMLTWGFEAEAARMAKRAYEIRKRRESGLSDDDDYSTDEEYQKIIAGEETEDDDSSASASEDPLRKQLKESFQSADADGSGNLTLREFIQLSLEQQQQQQQTGGMASMAAGDGPVLAGMMCRVQQLEKEVKSNSEKLDRILELLEPKKDK